MTRPDPNNELLQRTYEPLLPIEKKLIAWSLGTGLVLLAVLIVLTRVSGAA